MQCNPEDRACQDVTMPLSSYRYCCNSSCTFINNAGQCSCPWTVPGLPGFYRCEFDDFESLDNERFPNRQVVGTFRRRQLQVYNQTCTSSDRCAKAWVSDNFNESYIAGPLDYIFLLSHQVLSADLGLAIAANAMNGALYVEGTNAIQQQLCAKPPNGRGVAYKFHPDVSQETTNTAPCFLPPDFTVDSARGSQPSTNNTDVFYVRTLVSAAGQDLDASGARRNGATMSIMVEYANVYGKTKGTGLPRFGAQPPFYVYRVQGSFATGYRNLKTVYFSPTQRLFEATYGICFSFSGVGVFGQFDFLTLTQVIVTGTTLTGIGAIITHWVAVLFLQRSKYYRMLLEDSNINVDSLDSLHGLSDEELNRELSKRHLPQAQNREAKILLIYKATMDAQLDDFGKYSHEMLSSRTASSPRLVVDEAQLPRAVQRHLEVLDQVTARRPTRPAPRASHGAARCAVGSLHPEPTDITVGEPGV